MERAQEERPHLDRQRGKLFRKLMSGFIYHSMDQVRFLTLTTASGVETSLSGDFKKLTQRIRRLTPERLQRSGYLTANYGYLLPTKHVLIFPYKSMSSMETTLKFEFCAIQTTEGNGVLHVPYAGDFIPETWIRDTWKELHNTSIIDIRYVGKRRKDGRQWDSKKGLAGYCIQNYLAGQSELVRSWTSRNWTFPGNAKTWKHVWHLAEASGTEDMKRRAVAIWRIVMLNCPRNEKEAATILYQKGLISGMSDYRPGKQLLLTSND